MTNENPIDTAQEQISKAQEGQPSAPQYVTTAQFETLSQELKSQSSLINRGLDSVRRDLTERLDKERQDEALDEIPEEYRKLMGPIVKQITTLTNEVRTFRTGQGQGQVGANTGNADLDTYLNGHGLTGNEPGLDWDAYQGNDMQGFYASANKIMAAKANSPVPASVPEVPVVSPSPPIDGIPTGDIPSTSENDALDMYISGQITAEDFHSKVGW